MIKSISFPKSGEGYIYKKLQKPERPNKNMVGKMGYTKEDYDADLEFYKKELEYYNQHKGEYELGCSKNLVGRTFTFDAKKINVLFGPNACGKSTIIRAIAGHALIDQDGYSSLCSPAEFDYGSVFEDRAPEEDRIDQRIQRLSRNTSEVDWDGAPVYYHNFEAVLEKSGHAAGSLTDASVLIGSTADEVNYLMTRKIASQGQNTTLLLKRVLDTVGTPRSLSELFQKEQDSVNGIGKYINDTWKSAYKDQLDYLSCFEKFNVLSPATILFDEIDKSLDTMTVWQLYTYFLPKYIEKTGVQIILVTHNPLVMMRSLRTDESLFNIINVDEEYTKSFLSLMEGQLF